MMKRTVSAAALIAALSVCLTAQQSRDVAKPPATGTALISGTVMSAETAPVPIRRAIMVLKGEEGTQLEAVTDDAGAFAFTNLPPDRYSLVASKAGYIPATYGSKRPGGSGTPIVVADGQRVTAAMVIVKGSVITGTVRDEQGRPVPDVSVSVLRYATSFQTGERTLQEATIGSANFVVQSYWPDAFPGTAVTDDRGMYRIFGLPPGDYVVTATTRPWGVSILTATDFHQVTAADLQRAAGLLRASGNASAAASSIGAADISRVDYVPVYHPAAIASADAATIALGPAEERSGIDVLLRLVPSATIRGTLTAPDGSPIYNAQVSVMDPEYGPGRVARATRSNADGEFIIAGVPPGRYQMQASSYPERFYALAEISLEGRDISVSLTAMPGATMTGRVVFDGASRAPAASTNLIFLQRQTFFTGTPEYQLSPDGTFKLSGIAPGRYKLGINGRPPAGWVLRSAMVNGVDASDIAFDIKGQNIDNVVITLTDRPAEISGVLQNAAGEPAPQYGLLVFAADPRLQVPRTRRTQYVRPDIAGRFVVRDLPAGDYLISAVTDLENGQWNDPALLATLAASTPIRVSIAEGEKKVQDIRIGKLP